MRSRRRIVSGLTTIVIFGSGFVLTSPAEALDPPPADIIVTKPDGTPAVGAKFAVVPRVPDAVTPKNFDPIQWGSSDALGRINLNVPVNSYTLALKNANNGIINLNVSILACPVGINPQYVYQSDTDFSMVYNSTAQIFEIAYSLPIQLTQVDDFVPPGVACSGGGGTSCYAFWKIENPDVAREDAFETVAQVHTPAVGDAATATARYANSATASSRFGTAFESDNGQVWVGGHHDVANTTSIDIPITWPRFGYRSSTFRVGMHNIKQKERMWCNDFVTPYQTNRWRYRHVADHWNGPTSHGTVELSSIDTMANLNTRCTSPAACKHAMGHPDDFVEKVSGTSEESGAGITLFGIISWSKTNYTSATMTMRYDATSTIGSGVVWVWCDKTNGECNNIADATRLYQAYDPTP